MKAGHPLTYFSGDDFNFGVGSVLFTSRSLWDGKPAPGAIIVDGVKVLAGRVESNEILISAVIRDRDNRPVLVIRDNEMRLSSSAWDVTLTGPRLTLWWSARELGIDLRFAADGLYIERGALHANGYLFEIDSNRQLLAGGATLDHCVLPGTSICAGDTPDQSRCGIYIDEWLRYQKPGSHAFFKPPCTGSPGDRFMRMFEGAA
jgi:hypothetical protein